MAQQGKRAPHEQKTAMPEEIKSPSGPVTIRPCLPDDAPILFEAVRESIPELSARLPWCHSGYTIEESRTWLASCSESRKKGTEFSFAVIDRRDDVLVGVCGLNRIDPLFRMANLGYWIRTSRTGRGAATAAVRRVARFGFEELDLSRIEILVDRDNPASQRVAVKAGAFREAVLRNRIVDRGRPCDGVMFSLIPEDLQ